MTEKKACRRCSRQIDAVARICPYCNHDQTTANEQSGGTYTPAPAVPVQSKKQQAKRWGTKALVIAAVAALLVAVFAVGALVNGLGSRTEKKVADSAEEPSSTGPAAAGGASSMADLRLIPVGEAAATTVETPLATTADSAPNVMLPDELQRNDVTALPSEQYTKVVEEARPRSKPIPLPLPKPPAPEPRPDTRPQAQPSTEAPREQREQPREPSREPRERATEREARTDPVPVYQPLPKIRNRSREIRRDGTVRMRLTVGSDGKVKEVQVIEPLEGITDKVIAAVQQWRFKPATAGGVPVEGSFPVDISFKAGDE